MSRGSVVRAVSTVLTAATVVLVVGPVVGVANALASVSTVPANNAVVGKRPVISATYDAALDMTLSTIALTGTTNPSATPPQFTPVNSPKTFADANKTIVLTLGADLDEDHNPYTVTVNAVPATPGVPIQTQWTFTVDATGPTFSAGPTLTNPVTPANQSAATLTGTVSEPHGPVTVNVSVNDTNNATAAVTGSTSTSGAFSIPLDLSTLSDGTLTATVTATDVFGNVTTASPTATKDTTGPVLQTSVPADNTRVQQRSTVVLTYNEPLDATSTGVVLNNSDNGVSGSTGVSTNTITFTASAPFTELASPYVATFTVRDTKGNQTVTVVHFVIDDTAPGAPTVVLTDPVNIANQATATVSGTAEPNATVNVSVDDTTVGSPVTGTTTADGAGAYTKTLNLTSLSDGTLTATVTATDQALNTGPAGTDTATKDTVAPTVTNATLLDPITPANQAAATVTGVATAGSTVHVSVDDAGNNATAAVTGSTTAAGNGSYTVTLDLSSLSDGTLTASVTASDAANNTSAAVTDTATKDTGIPAAPTVIISPKPVNNANKGSITISGSAEPNATVNISVDDTDSGTTAVTSTATANGSGAYTKTLNLTSLTDGPITASVTQTDGVGNTGPAGTASTTKDVVAPNAPNVVLPTYANSNTLPVQGTAENNSSIALSATDGTHTTTGTATTNGAGDWSTTLDLTGFNQGTVTVTATATDAANNTSPNGSATTTRDTIAPGAPTVNLTDPILPANVTAVTVSGATGVAGASVAISVNDTDSGTAAVAKTVTADGSGNYTTTVDLTSLTDGTITATVHATDPAGNVGPDGTDTAAKDTTALALQSATPAASSTVKSPATVSATFNEALNTGTSTIAVTDKTASAIGGATSFSTDHKTIVFTPSVALSQNGSPYSVHVVAHDPVDGDTVDTTYTFTVDNSPPTAPTASMTDPVNVATAGMATVSGVAEAGSTVHVSIDDATPGSPVTGTTTAAGNGAYSKTLDVSSLADGTITATVYVTDVAGNDSPTTTDSSAKDMSAPLAPVPNLTDPVNAGNVTTVVLSGTAEAGSAIAYTIENTNDHTSVTGNTTANNAGDWTATRDLTAVTDGPLQATVTATDAASNTGPAGTDTATKDTVAPTAPTATLDDPVTAANQAAAGISGTAEPGSTVHISVDDTTVGSPVTKDVAADGITGAYTTTVDLHGLADGTLTATVTATDAEGNTGPAGTDTATKDATAPGAPTVNLADPVNLANQAAATVSGVAEPGSAVHVSVDDAGNGLPVTDDVTADGTTGAYTTTLDLSGLEDGTLTATVTATDGVGNTGAAGTDTAAKDTVAPNAPSVVLTDPVNSANKTAAAVTGTAEPGATVHVSVDDATVGSPLTQDVAANGTTGDWTATFDMSSLGDGTLTASATQTDTHGNTGTAGTDTATKDTVAPGAPTVSLTSPVNAANKAAVGISGTAEPGSTVHISVDDATVGSPVTKDVAADGTTGAYATTVDLTSLADGTVTATVTATDTHGNTGAAGTDTATKDTAAPAAPSVTLTDPVNAANKTAVSVTGTAEPGSAVHVSLDDATVGSPLTSTVSADGTTGAYTAVLDTTSLADGTLTATVTATDAVGNTGAAGTDTATKDTVVPGAPTVSMTDPVNNANQTSVVVSGVAEPASGVHVSVDDATPGSPVTQDVTANGTTGAYTVTLDVTALADGTVTATVTATDAAGNTSTAGTDSATKDSVVPAQPVVAAVAAVTHQTYTSVPFTGTADPGTSVLISVDDTDSGTTALTFTVTAAGNGSWSHSFDLSSLTDGTETVTVTATDAASNTSPQATRTFSMDKTRAFTITVDTTPLSGAGQSVTVTAHQTSATGSATDTTYTGTPVLSSLDGHFAAGTCGAASSGVASCTGVVFGDLGAQTLTATSGSGAAFVHGGTPVVVQPTALEFGTAPPAQASPGATVTFTVRPVAGVTGASITGYSATRTLVTTGGSTPASGTVLSCPTATCTVNVSWATRGPKFVSVSDNGAPPLTTQVATVVVPYVSSLTLARSATTVVSGGVVTLSGALRNTSLGTPIAGAHVRIYRRIYPATTYTLFASVTTTSTGAWSLATAVSKNTVYKASWPGDLSHDPVSSVLRTVLASSRISATWTLSGRTLTVTGGVTPSAAGRTISLQMRRADGTWTGVVGVAVDGTSHYRLTRTFAPGTYTLRMYIGATSANVAGASAVKTITVT